MFRKETFNLGTRNQPSLTHICDTTGHETQLLNRIDIGSYLWIRPVRNVRLSEYGRDSVSQCERECSAAVCEGVQWRNCESARVSVCECVGHHKLQETSNSARNSQMLSRVLLQHRISKKSCVSRRLPLPSATSSEIER